MRSEYSEIDSPARARWGLPKTTCTSGRPGTGSFAPYGIAAYAPTSATGTIGT